MHRIGIRREDKNPFERRAPLAPHDVTTLVAQHQIPLTFQPGRGHRVFADADYLQAGARLDEDLSACPVVMGVKEIPPELLAPNRTYVFFSHTIKGQPYNMPLLRRLIELGCTLVDYELIVDEAGRRLVFFGRHAGLAGMIDTLWALGQRLAQAEGIETPLAALRQAHGYASLQQARLAIAEAGRELRRQAPAVLSPLVAGFAGYGNVSIGAQEIYDLLEPEELTPDQLADVDPCAPGCYKVVFREEHMVQPCARDVHGEPFELQHYYDNPEAYRTVFARRYLERLTLLVNCIYWEERYPRLVTIADLERLYGSGPFGPDPPTPPARSWKATGAGQRMATRQPGGGPPRLRVIGDISCDVSGSIEATLKATHPDRPVYVYDLDRREAIDGVAGRGPVILAVDNLPAELPHDATESFSGSLAPLMPGLAAANLEAATLEQSELPEPLRRAVIVFRGQLTSNYEYLKDHLGQ